MTNTQSYVTGINPSQGEVNSATMRSDFEYALGQLNNHPPEHRTPELLFCLMRSGEARTALSAILGMD